MFGGFGDSKHQSDGVAFHRWVITIISFLHISHRAAFIPKFTIDDDTNFVPQCNKVAQVVQLEQVPPPPPPLASPFRDVRHPPGCQLVAEWGLTLEQVEDMYYAGPLGRSVNTKASGDWGRSSCGLHQVASAISHILIHMQLRTGEVGNNNLEKLLRKSSVRGHEAGSTPNNLRVLSQLRRGGQHEENLHQFFHQCNLIWDLTARCALEVRTNSAPPGCRVHEGSGTAGSTRSRCA